MTKDFLLHSNIPWLSCETLVLRKRCFDLLEQCLNRPLVYVGGGQGYGKSTLVLSYLQERQIPTILVSLRNGGGQLRVFLETVSNGLSNFCKNRVESEEIYLLGTLSNWSERLSIVVDCEKNNEIEPSLLDFILQLAQHCSRSVTFVLISRVRPKLPFIKLKAQGLIEEFKKEDIGFQAEEISDFFQLTGSPLEEIDSREVFNFTGGWALSLPYIRESWNKNMRNSQITMDPLLFELVDEVFSNELDSYGSANFDTLLHLSLLHELNQESISFLPSSLSSEKWKELTGHSFFLQKSEDDAYKMIPLVRKYLYHHIQQSKGNEELKKLHLQIAAKYEGKYQYYYAFAHNIAAGRYTEAARLMQVMMNFYTPDRFLLLIDGTLEQICPSISFSTFSMFLFRCVPIPVLQSYVPVLEKKLIDLKEEGLSNALLYLQHRLGIIQFYSGEVSRSKSLFLESLSSSERLNSHEFTIINLSLLAQCCRFEGELDEGIVFARKALSDIEKVGTYDTHMHTVWILTELLLEKGEIALAEPIFSELRKLSEQYHDEAARIYPLLAKAKLCRLKGDLGEALKLSESCLAHAEKFGFDPDLGWVYLESGLIYQGLNDSENANRSFQKSSEFFKHHRYFHNLVNSFMDDNKSTESINPKKVLKSEEKKTAIRPQEILEDKSAGILSFEILGPLHIWKDGKELKLQRKASLMLLIYLAVHYHKKIPKDLLLEDLFPESHFNSQNNRFYVSLSTLRKSLEPELKSGKHSSFILQSGEHYSLNLDRCSLDISKFDKLLESREESQEQRLHHLLQAEKLYKGNLLEEYPYEPFLEPVRERVKQTFQQALREISMIYWDKNDFRKGIQYFDMILENDRFDETVYWEYIRLLLNHGFLQNAKQIAQQMLKNIEQEMGIPVKQRLISQFPQIHL